MNRFKNFMLDSRTLSVLGVLALVALLFVGANTLRVALIWATAAALLAVLVWLIVWFVRRQRAAKAGGMLEEMIEQQAEKATRAAPPGKREEIQALRERMQTAIKTIKTSRLGLRSGTAALYELPWYMIIGNPAAGKSTAIVNSGLKFPFADKAGSVIQGIGGTRNCDWFFTSDGIILDTAGRYSVEEEDRVEWFGFLDLLKKNRPKAPINGIIIAASIADLTANRPEFAMRLAKNLRQRVQELTERLEIMAPVYVVFTKADLISGFTDFFRDMDENERKRIWGSTLPYAVDGTHDAVSVFESRFEELYEGLREMSLAQLAQSRGRRPRAGLLTLPLEFAAVKPSLLAFVATLFEDNPFQFKPVFRGFYFTSAVQEGASLHTSSQRVARRFGLNYSPTAETGPSTRSGFFLLELFRKVIFADRELVRQYANPTSTRLRYGVLFGSMLALGLALGVWAWSYTANRQLMHNVQADLDKAVKLQQGRVDLQSRLEAMGILEDRITQLDHYRDSRPWSLGFGLYQGDDIEQRMLDAYYAGLREVMLKPVTSKLENFLSEVNANAAKLQPLTHPPEGAGVSTTAAPAAASETSQYKNESPTNVEDAYNALKTYLMLGDKEHVEAGHLDDQITRFWRGWLESNRGQMTREETIRSAERIISFYLAHVSDDRWPQIDDKRSLVEETRESLRRVIRGMPARERVYSEIKARASTRFPPITVAQVVGEQDKTLVQGSYAIPGEFSREAWEGFVSTAIREASNQELQSSDWVLQTSSQDDLTLEGSPEHIQKLLVDNYKTEYIREWSKFTQGIAISDFGSFEAAAAGMDRLGDVQNSPLQKVMGTLYRETSWDNPSLVDQGIKGAKRGLIEWFKQTILRQAPSRLNLDQQMGNFGGASGGDANGGSAEMTTGAIGREFAGVSRLMVAKDKEPPLFKLYLDALSKIRSRLDQIKTQGDPGPGARQLMQQTLEGNGSELSEALKLVDEQLLTGMGDMQRQTLRPLLVRPEIQTFAAIVRPTEGELNRTWTAQVYEPFQKSVAGKYPFDPSSKTEAAASDIALIFGPQGAIAKFVDTALGPLVVRRGDTLSPKTWADMGITLAPEMTAGFTRWAAPLGDAGGSSGAAPGETVFQIMPQSAPGTTEYTVEIDGQVLRYRNTPPQWVNFVWPSTQGQPGARISAVTFEGRTVEVINFPGRYSLQKFLTSATRTPKDGGVFGLAWTKDNITVSVDLRIISRPQSSDGGAASPQGQGLRGVRLPTLIAGSPTGGSAAPVAGVGH